MGALLAASAFWFTALKWIGGIYLLYLGIKLFRAGVNTDSAAPPAVPDSLWKLFLNTWLLTALNSKGIIFFVAFLPQFLNVANDIAPQLWILSATFALLAAINATLYAMFATTAKRILSTPNTHKRFNLAGGTILSFAGI